MGIFKCIVETCTRASSYWTDRYCDEHEERLRKYGDVREEIPLHKRGRPPRTVLPKECDMLGCETVHYAKGLCKKHYERERRESRSLAPLS